jgi:polyphenol oxidase
MITLVALAGAPGVRHAFFTRRGGVSDGVFRSLNCGYGAGDGEDRVSRNRAIAMDRLGLAAGRLVTCRQVHSALAVAVTGPWPRAAAPRADGMATRVEGLALGVLAADCAPILFCDPVARVVGAAHAGWRGALAGIVEATVAAMEELGAERERMRAGIGPCIGSASYEVGPEFPLPFVAEDAAAAAYFAAAPRSGRFLFDLSAYVSHRLVRCRVGRVERAAHDTLAEADAFFSYRRACLRGEPAYGRALSAIMLED